MKLSKSQLRRIIRERVDAPDVQLDESLLYDHLRQVFVDNGGEGMSAQEFAEFEEAMGYAMRNLKGMIVR